MTKGLASNKAKMFPHIFYSASNRQRKQVGFTFFKQPAAFFTLC